MKSKLLKVIICLLIAFFIAITFLPKSLFSSKEVLFKVEKGEGSRAIALNLQKTGLITWSSAFRLYVLTIGVAGELQAGTYQLNSNMNIPEIAGIISKGKIAKEKITIIEGWTIRDIANYLEDKGLFTKEEILELTGNPLDPNSMEGYLFPDTYLISKDVSAEDLITLMHDNFENKIQPYSAEMEEKGLSLSQVITMASLIEKEVKTMEDKQLVSGIYWKRIKYGYPLQSDSSIAYIKGVPQWRYSYEDTRIDSPYNTYLNYGLPPGPISNPGLDSIEAALRPTESPYLYYLSTPQGDTIYSKTLAEHNANIEKYLK